MFANTGFGRRAQPMQKQPPSFGGQITPNDPSQAFGNMQTKPMQMGGPGMGGSMQKPQFGGGVAPPQMPGLPSGPAMSGQAPGGQFNGMSSQFGGPPQFGGPGAPPSGFADMAGQMQNARGGYQPQPQDFARRAMASRMLAGGRGQQNPSIPPQVGPATY